MKNKKLVDKILLGVLVVALIVGGVSWFMTRTTEREATAEELEQYTAYDVLWGSMPEAGEGQTPVDRILALCTSQEDTQMGENQYASYTSETLGQYLYNCAVIDHILVSADGTVFISYSDGDDLASARSVMLAYGPEGLQEKSVYEPSLDILFYESAETVIVYERASNLFAY